MSITDLQVNRRFMSIIDLQVNRRLMSITDLQVNRRLMSVADLLRFTRRPLAKGPSAVPTPWLGGMVSASRAVVVVVG